MKKLRISVFTVLVASLLFVSCKQQEEKPKDTNISTDVVNNPSTASGTSEPGSLPVFTIEKETHDFGRITQGDKVSYSFKFKNTGGSDLVISSAQGSCGCTVPNYPRNPIAPGG